MSPEELAEIEARAAKASPGPWAWVEKHSGDEEDQPGLISIANQEVTGQVCNFGNSTRYYPSEGSPPSEADAAFIAHARADVPALLAEVRRLQAEPTRTFEGWVAGSEYEFYDHDPAADDDEDGNVQWTSSFYLDWLRGLEGKHVRLTVTVLP